MPMIEVGRENSGAIDLYYEDHGTGRPVVLLHGWPQSSVGWERQVPALLDAGYRVITYDRRGFGASSKPATGYDYDTMTHDLNVIMERLDLHDVSLVGFSMGGGEVARYLGRYGSTRVCAAVFVSSITPFLLKGPDNPQGVDGSVFEGIIAGLEGDRPGFLTGFLANFYNVDVLRGSRVSDDSVRAIWNVAVGASRIATIECVRAWLTDFRADLAKIDVPTFFLHGDSDRIVPIEVSANRAHAMLRGSILKVIAGAPHGLPLTHASEFNGELLQFLEAHTRVPA